MSDELSLQFANDAFYIAHLNGDFAAMDAVWAHDAEVSCIHPGWGPLTGRAEVMESWRAILAHPDPPGFEYRQVAVQLHGACALVLAYEIFEEAFLIATNIFVTEDGGWKMVHHQSGGCPPEDTGAPERTVQ